MRGKRQRLAAAIDAALVRWCEVPFSWGNSDCLLELSNIIQQARGYDPAEPFRGHYASAIGAARVTKVYGGFAGALAEMAERSGWVEIDPKLAVIGDIGIIDQPKGQRCGVVRHHKLWLNRSLMGFAALPTALVCRAWRVN